MSEMTTAQNSVRSTSKYKRIGLILGSLFIVIAAIVFLGINVQSSQALGNKLVINTYYTDPEFTNEVGWQIVLRCTGTSGPVRGEMGEWVKQTESECIPPNPSTELRCYHIIYDQNTGQIYEYHRTLSEYCN